MSNKFGVSVCKFRGHESMLRKTVKLSQVAHAMADAAAQTLRKALENVDVSIVRYKENPDEAVGNGSGIK